jgi:hypothetical protein
MRKFNNETIKKIKKLKILKFKNLKIEFNFKNSALNQINKIKK